MFGLDNIDIDQAVVIATTTAITAIARTLRMSYHLRVVMFHDGHSHILRRESVNRFTRVISGGELMRVLPTGCNRVRLGDDAFDCGFAVRIIRETNTRQCLQATHCCIKRSSHLDAAQD